MMTNKMYLVTFACANDGRIAYFDGTTNDPAETLLGLRRSEWKRRVEAKRQKFGNIWRREFHIVNVLEVSTHDAARLSEPEPSLITREDWLAAFAKPDAVVEGKADAT
jgi:hypothetical protein